jgi:hypothetical protein
MRNDYRENCIKKHIDAKKRYLASIGVTLKVSYKTLRDIVIEEHNPMEFTPEYQHIQETDPRTLTDPMDIEHYINVYEYVYGWKPRHW